MTKKPLFTLLFLSCISAFSQTKFEKGYFISEDGTKTEAYIKNEDWKFNPTSVNYKLNESSETKIFLINDVSEFGGYDSFKYEKHIVDLDMTKDRISEIDENRQPLFKKDTLFLKLLVEGKANLYVYEDQARKRYFFNLDDSIVTQLVHKKYMVGSTTYANNDQYKQQILNSLKCENISIKDIGKISYKEASLTKIFHEYNECTDENFTNFREKKKRDVLNLTVRPGLNVSTLKVDHISDLRDFSIKNHLNFRIGVELEYILPFNNDKWSVFVEPTYSTFKEETRTASSSEFEHIETGDRKVMVEYTSFEIPIGLRYYMFLSEEQKLFINAGFVQDINNGFISYEGFNNLDFINSNNIMAGAGFKFKNKFVAEIRYNFPRELSDEYNSSIKMNSIAIILGYSIF